MKKGDIVLIQFPFTDFSEKKLRPVLVLGGDRDDLLVCFITSIISNLSDSDVFLKKDHQNNLKLDSVVKCFKLYTLHSSLVERKFGKIHPSTYQLVVDKIKNLIQL